MLAASAAARPLMRPRWAGKSTARTGVTAALRCCTTTAPTASVDGTAAPWTVARPACQLRLAVVRPDLLDDWVPELNDVAALEISCNESTTLVWWRCSHCQGRYQCTVHARVARGGAACPNCSGSITATSGAPTDHLSSLSAAPVPLATQAPPAKAEEEVLDKTHPDLATRWDTTRNGTLRPSHVTASSTRQVWWLPAASTATTASCSAQSSLEQRSFLRPVFAFVQDPTSPEEQAAATAAMEWRLLHEIRRVAHIESAEKAGAIPVALSSNPTGLRKTPAWLNGFDSALNAMPLPPPDTLSAADVDVVARMWKGRLSQRSPPEDVADDAPPRPAEPGLTSILPRELFSRSPAATRQPGATVEEAAASAVRQALLRQYSEFVCLQRRRSGDSQARVTQTPVLSGLKRDGAPTCVDSLIPAKESPSSWTDFYALSRDAALPRGYIDPNASLYFPSAAEGMGTAGGEAGQVDSLRLTPSEGDTTAVLSKYPRRPRFPQLREDDVMQATPPMMFTDANNTEDCGGASEGASTPQLDEHRKGMSRVNVPFGHATTAAEESAALLAAEYDFDGDDDDGRQHGGRLPQQSQDAINFASELHSASRASAQVREDTRRRRCGAATAASLLDSAIAALGEVFSDESNNSSQRYHREARRSEALRAESRTSSGLSARRTVAHPRRFRLSPPQEASQKETVHAVVGSAAGDCTGPVQPMHFDAPQTPRKVARPRRVKKEISSVAAV